MKGCRRCLNADWSGRVSIGCGHLSAVDSRVPGLYIKRSMMTYQDLNCFFHHLKDGNRPGNVLRGIRAVEHAIGSASLRKAIINEIA